MPDAAPPAVVVRVAASDNGREGAWPVLRLDGRNGAVRVAGADGAFGGQLPRRLARELAREAATLAVRPPALRPPPSVRSRIIDGQVELTIEVCETPGFVLSAGGRTRRSYGCRDRRGEALAVRLATLAADVDPACRRLRNGRDLSRLDGAFHVLRRCTRLSGDRLAAGDLAGSVEPSTFSEALATATLADDAFVFRAPGVTPEVGAASAAAADAWLKEGGFSSRRARLQGAGDTVSEDALASAGRTVGSQWTTACYRLNREWRRTDQVWRLRSFLLTPAAC